MKAPYLIAMWNIQYFQIPPHLSAPNAIVQHPFFYRIS